MKDQGEVESSGEGGNVYILHILCEWELKCDVSRLVVEFSSVAQSYPTLCNPMNQASLSITKSWSLTKPMSIKSVKPSNHLILCCPLLLLLSIFPSISVFSSELALHITWTKYWSFSFISPSTEHPGLISFRMDQLDLLAVQGTLKSLLQHHSSKASILQRSAFLLVQFSHPYMTTGKTIALTRWTFVDKINVSAFYYVVQVGHNFPSKEQRVKSKELQLSCRLFKMKSKRWKKLYNQSRSLCVYVCSVVSNSL